MFLGLQIHREEDGSICLHQTNYIKKVVERFELSEANSVTIPADPHEELCVQMHPVDQQKITNAPYREAIGSLLFVSNGTRPDIALAVNRLSRYMEAPHKLHWNAVKRVIKYLKGTMHLGLKFKPNKNACINAFSDSDFAGDTLTRKSTTGFLVYLGNSVISWNSQKQSVVALSTTEAEYIAASETVREIVWVRRLISEISFSKELNATLYMDNQSAIKLIKNPVFHKGSKYIDIRYHYIRDKYEQQDFLLEYINTNDQVADLLTKPLPRNRFELHHNKICDKVNSIK